MKLPKNTISLSGLVFIASAGVMPLASYADDKTEKMRDAKATITDAAEVIRKMKTDPEVLKQLEKVEGVFIIPDYARAGVIVGGYGGQGVLLTRQGTDWSDPVFYNLGGISGGAEIGAEVGEIAMLLTNEKAVDSFMTDNNFSLNADAGLTLVDFSERAKAASGKGDVIVWSNTRGAYADLAVSVENIAWDKEETKAYYNKEVTDPSVITSGKVTSNQENVLADLLP